MTDHREDGVPNAEQLLRREGARVCNGLRDHGSGRSSLWREALQAATWISDYDSAILDVADELFRCGHELRCDHLISAYAVGAQARHHDSGATPLLDGILVQVVEYPQALASQPFPRSADAPS